MAAKQRTTTKQLRLLQILLKESDKDHGLTIHEIMDRLKQYDMQLDRRTIYNAIDDLKLCGYNVEMRHKGVENTYHLTSRPLETAELKLLIDSVQCARFMTPEQSEQLIKKLLGFASNYEARDMNRQVVTFGRIKSANAQNLDNVDLIHKAIRSNTKITFQYFNWDHNKKPQIKHDGAFYIVSPLALLWDDQYYYLVGYNEKKGEKNHYRVDKMISLSLIDEKRIIPPEDENFDISLYSKRLFNMFDGNIQHVTLECRNDMAGVIIDRFGKDVPMLSIDDEHFKTVVNVAVSDQFLCWVLSVGGGIKVVKPDDVVDRIREISYRILRQYGPKDDEM